MSASLELWPRPRVEPVHRPAGTASVAGSSRPRARCCCRSAGGPPRLPLHGDRDARGVARRGTGALRRRRSPGPLPRRPGRPRDAGADVGRRAPRRPGRAAHDRRGGVARERADRVLGSLLHALFYFYTGYGLLRYMFADNWVTRDELYATGAAFTVVAWGYASSVRRGPVHLAQLVHDLRRGRPGRPARGSSCSTCRSRR